MMHKKSAQIDSPKKLARDDSLRKLSDSALLSRLEKVRGTERAVQHAIVLYLAEVERRKLYLPRGYGSLFEFCTEYLKYSRSSAGRRIGAARCISRYPRMAVLFGRGECDLTVLSLVAGIVTKENCAEIAVWLKGRSLREVEAYVARRHPAREIRDRVRQIYVMSTKPVAAPGNGKARTVPVPVNGRTTPAATPVNGKTSTAPTHREGTEPQAANADPSGAECKVSLTFTPSAGSKTAQCINNKSDKNHGVLTGAGALNENSVAFGGNCTRFGIENLATVGEKYTKSGGDRNFMQANAGACGTPPAERAVIERKFKLQFTVAPDFMAMLERVTSLLSTMYPQGLTFEMVFTILMKEYLDRHDPERRAKRRDERKKRAAGRGKEPAPRKTGPDVEPDNSTKRRKNGSGRRGQADTAASGSGMCKQDLKKRRKIGRTRHIPRSVRDEVFTRDGGRCTFVGDDGVRCGSTWDLEIDHIRPYAKGGGNAPNNLRLLCARHNKLEAERQYGKDHMERFHRRE